MEHQLDHSGSLELNPRRELNWKSSESVQDKRGVHALGDVVVLWREVHVALELKLFGVDVRDVRAVETTCAG